MAGHRMLTRAAVALPWLLWALQALADGPPPSAPPDTPAHDPPGSEPARAPALAPLLRWRPMEVVINGSPVGSWVLLERDGVLLASTDMLEQWRIGQPGAALGVGHAGQWWYPLPALAGYSARFDPAEQALALQFSVDAFKLTRVEPGAARHLSMSPLLWAGFLNYDLALNAMQDGGSWRSAPAGLFELGLTGPYGVLTHSQAMRSSLSGGRQENVRLESTYTLNLPQQQLTLRLGDSITSGAAGSQAFYFGGLQIARNFALNPGFVTQPIPVLSGTAASASTVELYVNDVLRQVSNVPSGPFTVQNPSLLNADGQVRVVVKDVLGRETVTTQSLYRYPRLLAQGLSDWAVETGAVRYGLGQVDSRYGERFVSGHWRHGLRPWLTLQMQGQGSHSVQGLRLGAAMALSNGWFLETGGAVSKAQAVPQGPGHEYQLGLSYSQGRRHLLLQQVSRDAGYRMLGLPSTLPFRTQQTLGAGMAVSSAGHLAVQHSRIRNQDGSLIASSTVQYSHALGNGRLQLSLARLQGLRRGESMMVSWVMPLDLGRSRATAQSYVQRLDGRNAWGTGVSQPVMPDASWGWRVAAGETVSGAFGEGGLYHQGERALVQLDLRAREQSRYGRASMQGSLVALDGEVFAARPVRGSFAVVEVPGQENVGIALNGQTLGRSNAQGKALIAQLQAFYRNTVALNPNDLPISAELPSLSVDVVPAWRSAVKARFAVRVGQSALLKVRLDNGSEAPLGSRVRIVGDVDDSRVFMVGHKGLVWLTGLPADAQLQMHWGQQSCSMRLQVPHTDPDTVWRPDPVTCRQEQP